MVTQEKNLIMILQDYIRTHKIMYGINMYKIKIESLVLVYTVYIPYNRSKKTDMVLIAAD